MIFVSSRTIRPEQDNRENRTSNSIQISVPCELVMDLLSQGAILQLQMGPVPLRPDLARPGPRPERPEATNPRPEAEMSNIRPNVADDSSRPNPNGRSENDVPRPERPMSRCPPIRPVLSFIDWSSLSHNAEVISVPSEDDDYVPRSPEYEPDSPGPVVETEYQNLGPDDNESGPYRRTIFSNVSRDANKERSRSPLGSVTLMQRVSPFLREIGQRRRHQLGRIRPM